MTSKHSFTPPPLMTALRDVQRLMRFTTRAEVREAGVRPGSEGFKEAVQTAKQSTFQRALEALTLDEQEAATIALRKITEALGGEEALAQAREQRDEHKRHGHHHGHCRHRLANGEVHHSGERRAGSARRTQAAFERGFAAGYTQGARA